MNNCEFENNVWITFDFNNIQCIGRTFLMNELPSIILIDKNCDSCVIPFFIINNPKKIILTESINSIKHLSKPKQSKQTKQLNKLFLISLN